MSRPLPDAPPVIGRDAELDEFGDLVNGALDHGGALVLLGAPGIGKTTMLDALAASAGPNVRVLRCRGSEFDARGPFVGLGEVLTPLLPESRSLPLPGQAAVLRVALGMTAGPPPSRLVLSTAALSFIRRSAALAPLLVIVDDAQWLDPASADVLAFVARRLRGSRVAILISSREAVPPFTKTNGFPVHEIKRLSDEAADDLLRIQYPTLAGDVRARVLAEAQGNPMAILELPMGLTGDQLSSVTSLPPVLPLTDRLQEIFVDRISALHTRTQDFLLMLALSGTADLGALQAAFAEPLARHIDAVEIAALAHLEPDTGRMAFAHPMIRSSVVMRSSPERQRGVHRLLADALADRPEERARHLADSIDGTDDEAARLMADVGLQALQRGDAAGAVSALTRAADLSVDRPDRARRLSAAASVMADLSGDLVRMAQLVDQALRTDPRSEATLEYVTARALLLLNDSGDVDTAHRQLVQTLERRVQTSSDHAVGEALWMLAVVCSFGGRVQLWEPFYDLLQEHRDRLPRWLTLANEIAAIVGPADPGAGRVLDAAIAGLADQADPTSIVRLAFLAADYDRAGGYRAALQRVRRDGPRTGAVATVIYATMILADNSFAAGNWDETAALVDEARALCETHGYPLYTWFLRSIRAMLAAARGDQQTLERLTAEMLAFSGQRGALRIGQLAHHALAVDALGRKDFAAARFFQ